MGGRLIQPGSPQRVAIDSAVEYSRPANGEEMYVMEEYAVHADHCFRCRFPKRSKGLCSRGSGYATDVAQYVYQKMGLPYSLLDRVNKRQTVRLELPPTRRIGDKVYDMQPVKDLLVAAREGLDVPGSTTRRQVVIEQPKPLPRTTSVRKPERRADADYVEIRPAGKREDRRERDGRPSKPKYEGRGSLYKRDEEERRQRQSRDLEPVYVVAEPRRKYRDYR